MKQLLLTGLLLCNALCLKAQPYAAMQLADKPEAGKEVNILYDPGMTKLRGQTGITGFVYYYGSNRKIGGQKLSFSRNNNTWEAGTFVPDSAVMLSIVAASADGSVLDNNRDSGYLFPVYKNGVPVPFAFAAMSDLLGEGPPGDAHLKKNLRRAVAFMKKEIRLHPSGEKALRGRFYNLLANSPDKEDKVELVRRLRALKSDRESDLMMEQLYLSYFGTRREADSLDKLLTEKFPDGKYVRMKKKRAARAKERNAEPVDAAAEAVKRSGITKADVLEKVRSEMTDEPAPAVTLRDINGRPVSLDPGALQGKVIVLDFWATWCKPCIASFPAMQKVIRAYSRNKAVKFFFITTLEGDDPVKKVKHFIERNPYPFTYLIDERTGEMHLFKAYTNYKGEGGIPYKAVIDGRGHIRFKVTGFSGDEDRLVAELSDMIDLTLKSDDPN